MIEPVRWRSGLEDQAVRYGMPVSSSDPITTDLVSNLRSPLDHGLKIPTLDVAPGLPIGSETVKKLFNASPSAAI
jgi:hypothetical protein